MFKNLILILTVTTIGLIFFGVTYMFLFTNDVPVENNLIESPATSPTIKLVGQLYQTVSYDHDNGVIASSTIPLLHLSEPLFLSETQTQYPGEYIELIIPDSYDWKSLIGSGVSVEGALNEAAGSVTFAMLDVVMIERKTDFEIAPVLTEETIVGMILFSKCAVGKITFYLPNNQTASIRLPSDASDTDSRIQYGTWTQNEVVSLTPFPYTHKNEFKNFVWSDREDGPHFYGECHMINDSTLTTVGNDSGVMYALGRYIPMFAPEVQNQIYELHEMLR